jgi:hypothetical protein
MAERRVSEIVRERDRFRQELIGPHRPRNAGSYLSDLYDVVEACPKRSAYLAVG